MSVTKVEDSSTYTLDEAAEELSSILGYMTESEIAMVATKQQIQVIYYLAQKAAKLLEHGEQ